MDIVLYRNLSVENKINKSLTQVAKYPSAVVVEGFNDYEISVQFTVPNSTLSWSNVNYMAVDNAYYFVDSVDHVNNGVAIAHGRMDLLMTYKEAISELTVLAERSTSHGSARVEDENRLMAVEPYCSVMEWPAVIDDSQTAGCYILTTSQMGYSTD